MKDILECVLDWIAEIVWYIGIGIGVILTIGVTIFLIAAIYFVTKIVPALGITLAFLIIFVPLFLWADIRRL